MKAAYRGWVAICQMLIDAGTDVNAQDIVSYQYDWASVSEPHTSRSLARAAIWRCTTYRCRSVSHTVNPARAIRNIVFISGYRIINLRRARESCTALRFDYIYGDNKDTDRSCDSKQWRQQTRTPLLDLPIH